MQAVALEPQLKAAPVAEATLTRGVISRALPYANAVSLSPPLIVSDDEIDELVDAMGEAIGEVASAS
jgi:adenosylmethionine-8-amino-7-oxononanoate aminotransferase